MASVIPLVLVVTCCYAFQAANLYELNIFHHSDDFRQGGAAPEWRFVFGGLSKHGGFAATCFFVEVVAAIFHLLAVRAVGITFAEEDPNGELSEELALLWIVFALDFPLVVLRCYTGCLALLLRAQLVRRQNLVMPVSALPPTAGPDSWSPTLEYAPEEGQSGLPSRRSRFSVIREHLTRVKKRIRWWHILVFIGVSAGCALMVVVILIKDPPVDPPRWSSCLVAMEKVSTCQNVALLGGDSILRLESKDDCCAACDQNEDCQGWTFSEHDGTCQIFAFQSGSCSEDPGLIQCRCFTHAGNWFGFVPSSGMVWVPQSAGA